MSITIKSLIAAGPFSDDKKKLLLEKFDTFSEDQKLRLGHAAWTGIAMKYYAHLKYELHLEVAEGKRDYNPNDFEEVRAKLLHELAQKLQSAESKEQIDEVRKKLEEFKPQTGTPLAPSPKLS